MYYGRVRIPGASYFFTVVTCDRRPIFQHTEAIALFDAAVTRIRQRHPFEIDATVILPDHIHTIWTLPDGDADFSTRWRLVKEAFTKPFVRQNLPSSRSDSRRSKGEQPVWQRRFWEHLIRDEADYVAHVDYIHINPVHHGLAAAASEWPHSSFAEWVERGVYAPNWGSDKMPPLPDWAVNVE